MDATDEQMQAEGQPLPAPESAAAPAKRPTAVLIVGLIAVMVMVANFVKAGILLYLLAQAGVFTRELSELLSDPSAAAVSQLIGEVGYFLVAGILLIPIVYGFFRLRSWAWLVLMTWLGINLTVNLARTFTGNPHYGLLFLNALLVLMLNQEEVQLAFGIRGRGEDDTRPQPMSAGDGV